MADSGDGGGNASAAASCTLNGSSSSSRKINWPHVDIRRLQIVPHAAAPHGSAAQQQTSSATGWGRPQSNQIRDSHTVQSNMYEGRTGMRVELVLVTACNLVILT